MPACPFIAHPLGLALISLSCLKQILERGFVETNSFPVTHSHSGSGKAAAPLPLLPARSCLHGWELVLKEALCVIQGLVN